MSEIFNEIIKIILLGIIFTVTDSIYLFSASNFFNKLVNKIQGEDIEMNYGYTALCYVFLIFGLKYFVISKANDNDINKTLLDAAVLGWVIYGVFETTNGAIFKDWSIYAFLMDTTWGGILYALTTFFYLKLIGLLGI
uniref:Putative membrane protein n=1 Tax=Megaviridae environmental sample TaxID=1737588 RepID=A0A5J6VL01_9VIRU|nr:MAG: putative membrane protein [Megaviridae environmental sample]